MAALIARLFYGTNEDAVREFCASVANQHATFFSADKSATDTAGRWAFTLYNLGLVGLHPPGGLWTLTHPDLTTKYQALVDFVDVAAHRSETSDAATESYHYARFRSECPT